MAANAGARVLALTIDYNQRHRCELDAAAKLAAHYGVERHIRLPLDLRGFGGSALTDDIAVPKGGVAETGIPVLGTVSEVVRPEEKARSSRMRIAFAALGAVLVGLYGILVAAQFLGGGGAV